MAKKIITIIFFIVGAIAGKYAYNVLFGQSEIASFEDSDWDIKRYAVVKVELPFDLSETDLKLPEYVKKHVKMMENYKYESKSISFFISFAEYREGIDANIDGAVDGAINNMKAGKGISDFTYTVKNIEKNFIEGRLIEGTFKLKEQDVEFIGEIFLKDLKLLQILAINLNYEENREIRDRILKSIKFDLL